MLATDRTDPPGSTNHRQTARDTENLAGHVRGVIAREEEDRPRKVVRLTDPTKRDGASERLLQLLGIRRSLPEPVKEGGVGGARAHDVAGNPVAGVLTREGLGEGYQTAFAGRVDRLAGGSDPGCVRGDIDDPPASTFHHAGQNEMQHVEGANEVDVDQFQPLVNRGLKERLEDV